MCNLTWTKKRNMEENGRNKIDMVGFLCVFSNLVDATLGR